MVTWHYHLDENFTGARKIVAVLRDIHARRGEGDVKLTLTPSQFLHETGFAAEDKDLYYQARLHKSIEPLIANWPMVHTLPPDAESHEYQRRFREKVEHYEAMEGLEPRILRSIREKAASIIARLMPHLKREEESIRDMTNRIDLHLKPETHPDNELYNKIIIASFQLNHSFNKLARRDKAYDAIATDLVDRELRRFIESLLASQQSKPETDRFIIVTRDFEHKKELEKIIGPYFEERPNYLFTPASFIKTAWQVVDDLENERNNTANDELRAHIDDEIKRLRQAIRGCSREVRGGHYPGELPNTPYRKIIRQDRGFHGEQQR